MSWQWEVTGRRVFAMRYIIMRPSEAMLGRLFQLRRLIFFYDPMRLRCQAIFVVLVRFIIERQDVAALQPGDAGGGLGQLKCLLCWLIMIAMLTKHSNKALTLPLIKS